MEVKISIIMGIYNCEKYLKESINSILNQTFTEWELIMCDDGSTDNTYLIAKGYQEKYSEKIVLLKNEKNMGLNITLNKCLKKAKGKYIARQDGDDISVETRLEKEYNFLENHKEFALVSAKMIFFDEKGEWGESHYKQIPTKLDFVYNSPFAHPPALIRKDVMDEVNGYTEGKKFIRVEDYHLWLKIYEKGYKGYNLDEVLYKMRDDNDAYKRRNWQNRVNEMSVRWIGYRMLKIPFYKYIYCLRPIVIYFLPNSVYKYLHKKRNKQGRKINS